MLEKRSFDLEFLDNEDITPDQFVPSYKCMEEVNLLYGGGKVVRDFFKGELSKGFISQGENLSILDLGCGSCDIPLSVARWGRKKGIPMDYTCVDRNDAALELAEKKMPDPKTMTLLKEDIFNFTPDREYDYVTASMLCHHMDEKLIAGLIEQYRPHVRKALLINDLERNYLFYFLTYIRTIFTERINRNDARLSVRKGFTPWELESLLSTVPHIVEKKIIRRPLFRLLAVLRFTKEK